MITSPIMKRIKELQDKNKTQKQAKSKTANDDWFMLDEIEDMEELGF